jgi:hypothetical protein
MKKKDQGIWDSCEYCGICTLITEDHFKKGRTSNVTGEELQPGEWVCEHCDNKNKIGGY